MPLETVVQHGTEVIKIGGVAVPLWLARNTLKALGKGVGDLATSLMDVPRAKLEGIAKELRAETAARVAVTKAAGASAARIAESNDAVAERAFAYYAAEQLQAQGHRERVARLFLRRLGEIRTEALPEPAEEVDSDWLTIFWRLAETKSKGEVQEVLGLLLAKEVSAPKSIGAATLHVLSLTTSDEARRFERLCNLSMDDGKDVFVLPPKLEAFQRVGGLDTYGLSVDDIFELEALGVIRSAEILQLGFTSDSPDGMEKVDYGGSPALLKLNERQFKMLIFTRAGKELRRLMPLSRHPQHCADLKTSLGDALRESPIT